jgi:nucleoprotein TPR
MKLRLAEAQAETAKKAEERIGNESSQLRNEVSRQGALIESIQRIEASLSAKTVADEASSKAQVAALSDKLSLQESKFTAEVAKLNDIISDHTLRIQEIEKEREQAVREALGAKRDYLKANSELQESNKKSKTLEAQLRLAKKKLGAFSDEEDTEAQLRNKVLSLTEELEAASKESEALKERVSAYAKLAKDNENAVAELTEATKAAEKAQKEEVGNLKSQLDTSQSESAKTKEVIAELTNDLSSQREEREKAVQEVTQKLSEMESEAVKFKKDAQAAESRHADLEAEVIVLRADASNSQVGFYATDGC